MIRRRLLTAGLVAASLLSVAACSDDDNGLTIPQTTNPAGGNVTLPSGGGDLPVTIPNVPGVNDECLALINAISAAGMAAAGQGDMAQAAAYMQGLVDAVPDELKADAQIFADAYAGWLAVLAQYNNDFTQAMRPRRPTGDDGARHPRGRGGQQPDRRLHGSDLPEHVTG